MNAASELNDSEWMRKALGLAVQGQGLVEPNPLVGCVLVAADGTEIGQGYHARFGEDHAERIALADAATRGQRGRLAGATAYISLEPCCHFGKTPPCTRALIESGIRRVVVAMLDPFPQVRGQGCAELQAQGIAVTVGVEQAAARRVNAPYLKRQRLAEPWIIAKWAMSLDGKIATYSGDSQWISCAESRRFVHELRGRMDAILVGSGTAIADDPLLTARPACLRRRQAIRVVADSRLRLPLTSQLLRTAREYPTLLLAGPEAEPADVAARQQMGAEVYVAPQQDATARLKAWLQFLVAEKQVTNLLVEGGATLLGSLADAGQLDQCEVFIAPKIIGGQAAVSPIAGRGIRMLQSAAALEIADVARCGRDVHLHCLTYQDAD